MTEVIRWLMVYYLLKIIINTILTAIGIIKDRSSLYYYYKAKEKYPVNNFKSKIIIVFVIFLIYLYITEMKCVEIIYKIFHIKEQY